MSSINYSIGNGGIIIMIILFLLTIIGCLFVLVCKDCKDVRHNCPRCGI